MKLLSDAKKSIHQTLHNGLKIILKSITSGDIDITYWGQNEQIDYFGQNQMTDYFRQIWIIDLSVVFGNID